MCPHPIHIYQCKAPTHPTLHFPLALSHPHEPRLSPSLPLLRRHQYRQLLSRRVQPQVLLRPSRPPVREQTWLQDTCLRTSQGTMAPFIRQGHSRVVSSACTVSLPSLIPLPQGNDGYRPDIRLQGCGVSREPQGQGARSLSGYRHWGELRYPTISFQYARDSRAILPFPELPRAVSPRCPSLSN